MIKFLKTPLGKLLIFIVLMVLVFIGLQKVFERRETLKGQINQVINEPLETVYNSPLSEILPDKKESERTPDRKISNKRSIPKPGKRVPTSKSERVIFKPEPSKRSSQTHRREYRNPTFKPYTPPIDLYTANPSSIPLSPESQSAPYGQLLRCELTQTVMTSNLQTPIIGMVTEPLWWNGKEIIPAGVIVHGVAASSPVRDRVGAGTKWILVWPHRNEWNGKKLVLNAIALACDRTESTWAKIDGSAGIKGDVISNQDQQRLYAYIASFISGLGEGMVSESEDTTGSSTTKTTGGTLADALGKAFQKSASDISDQLFKDLSQNIFYVEAQAGTEFYLYITQDIRISEVSKKPLQLQFSNRKKR
jgi:hypothetical protein